MIDDDRCVKVMSYFALNKFVITWRQTDCVESSVASASTLSACPTPADKEKEKQCGPTEERKM